MFNFQSGVLDKTRLFSNILMVVLLAGNIFFSIQYAESIKQQAAVQEDVNAPTRLQTARFLKYFIDTVLNTKGTISFDDRVKLENDIRQIKDVDLIRQWDTFVGSKDATSAQDNAVKLMSLLVNKLII